MMNPTIPSAAEADHQPTFDDTHYMPILKGRAAEYDALETLSESERSALTPLIELMPVPFDFAEERPATSGDEHISNAERNILRAWGTSRRLFVDLLWLGPEARTIAGDHPMAFMLQRANSAGLLVVPVVGFDRDVEYRAAAREGHSGRGVCVRLRSADLAQAEVADTLNALLEELNLTAGDVDLLVDLKELNPAAVDFNVIGALGVLTAVPEAESWRSLTLAGSAFPQDLSGMQPASEERFPRTEWAVWSALRGRRLARRPAFGDYAIAHPDPPKAIDPRLLRVSAQLRYTTDNDWLVFKGRNIRDFGNEQFIDICQRISQSDEFRGADFSWGDTYIARRAEGSDTRPGNPRTWRKVGTSHHIATVISQIASLDS